MRAKIVFTIMALGLLLGIPYAPATADTPAASKVVFFASDGMRPDLMERYAGAGLHAHLRQPHEPGRQGRQRPHAGLPAQTRASAGTP